ncbi:MAG: hypothetical protein Q7J15_01530 [Candidatus Desulfaltia sp.]|nr:hypothetical protein [Candidatus Desulfaltia sp.]
MTTTPSPCHFTGVALRGKVDGYYNVNGLSVPVLMLDTTIYRGNSDSPVFNEDSRVVGVIFTSAEGRNGEKNRGLAVCRHSFSMSVGERFFLASFGRVMA